MPAWLALVRVVREYESKWSAASVSVTFCVHGLLSSMSGLSRVLGAHVGYLNLSFIFYLLNGGEWCS